MDPLVTAANAISDSSPNIKKFAQLAASRILALETASHPPPPPSTVPASHYELDLAPNWNNGADSNDVANNYNAVWLWSNSGQGYVPPNGADKYRVLLLDPRSSDAAGKPGNDDWWFVIQRGWPASFDPTRTGAYGALANFHNVASQDGPGGGVGWGFGSGVSCVSLNWRPQDSTPSFGFEYQASGGVSVPLPQPTRDVVHEYVLHFVAGRTDGTTAKAGSYSIWADGALVTTVGGINTIQKAVAPDGKAYVQRWMAACWDGYYTRNLGNRSAVWFNLTRCGRTLAEAQADVPVVAANTFDTQKWNGQQPNLGAPTLKVV